MSAQDKGWARILADIHDPDDMKRFLAEMLTPTERRNMDLRWRLMKLLTRGMPQREIASRLGISLCKITRGARILKKPESVARAILEGSIKTCREEC